MIKNHDFARPSQFFEEFNSLRVILLLGLCIIGEGCVLGRVAVKLKASVIKGHRLFLSSKILNDDVMIGSCEVSLPFPRCGVGVDMLECSFAAFWLHKVREPRDCVWWVGEVHWYGCHPTVSLKYYGDSERPETIAYADENARHAMPRIHLAFR